MTGLFDVLGYPDMIKPPGDSLLQLIPNEVIQLLQTVKDSGMAIELNTSGYQRNVGEPYPGLDRLPLIRDYSIPFTTASDVHHPDQVGFKFKSIYHIIKEQGIDNPVVYDKRRHIERMIQ